MELPVFKPSGQGGSQDLANIYESQAISWGAYKSGLTKRFTKECGIAYIDGIEVFNDVNIMSGVLDSGSEIYEMLKFIGFSNEDLSNLAETVSDGDNQIEKVWMNFKADLDYEKDNFDYMIGEVLNYIYDLDYVEITVRNNMYAPGSEPTPYYTPRSYGLSYNSHSEELEYNDRVDDEIDTGIPLEEPSPSYGFNRFTCGGILGYNLDKCPTKTYFNSERLLENFEIKIIKEGQDKTSQYPLTLVYFITFLAIVEETMVTTSNRLSYNKPRQVTYMEYNDETGTEVPITEIWTENIVRERYNFTNILPETLRSEYRYNFYVQTCQDLGNCGGNPTDEQKESKVPSYNYPAYMWLATEVLINDQLPAVTSGLFYYYKGEPKLSLINGEIVESFPNKQLFLTVDGVKKAQPDEFGYYFSLFLNIEFVQKEPSWIKKFIGGIMKAFLSFIDALIGIFLKIPVLKQSTEIILSLLGSLFGVDATSARAILSQIILAVVVIFIGMFVGPLIASAFNSLASTVVTTAATTVATGTTTAITTGMSAGMSSTISTLVTYSSNALTLFEAGMRGKAIGEAKKYAIESANRTYRNNKAQEEAAKSAGVVGGTMGGADTYEQMNNGMYNIMFNPFYFHPQAIPAEELPNGYLF